MKQILKKLIPCYRARDYIVEKINNLENQITDQNKKNEYLFWLLQKKKTKQ